VRNCGGYVVNGIKRLAAKKIDRKVRDTKDIEGWWPSWESVRQKGEEIGYPWCDRDMFPEVPHRTRPSKTKTADHKALLRLLAEVRAWCISARKPWGDEGIPRFLERAEAAGFDEAEAQKLIE
jgi:hypothetical protein